MLLLLVSGICVRRGSFRRLPALKASVVVGGRFGSVAWLLGLVYLVGCVSGSSSIGSCSVVRFRSRRAGGEMELLWVVSGCLGFVRSVGVVGGLCVCCVYRVVWGFGSCVTHVYPRVFLG